MAFRRLSTSLPLDPYYPSDLHALGFERSSSGHYVRPGTQAAHFDFYHTDSDRANTVRKEAMCQAVRHDIYTQLAALDIRPLYCTSVTSHLEKPPNIPAIPIYTTAPILLHRKPRILVIVGEHIQDPCIWSWRSLLTSGGLFAGTAIGLVHKLHAWGSAISAAADARHAMPGFHKVKERLEIDGHDISSERARHEAPGLVILNPGQLCWSNLEERAMTLSSWLARRREGGSAIGDAFPVDPMWNRVPGHETPEAHVRTVVERILPNLLRKDVEIYAVGIGDGGEVLVGCLERDLRGFCGGRGVKAVAFMQSSHRAEEVRTEDLKAFLENYGRSWVVTPGLEKGVVVGVPGGWVASEGEKMRLEVQREQVGTSSSPLLPPPLPPARQNDLTMNGGDMTASMLLDNPDIESETLIATAIAQMQETIQKGEVETKAAAAAPTPNHLHIEDAAIPTHTSPQKEEEEEEKENCKAPTSPSATTPDDHSPLVPTPAHPTTSDQTHHIPDARRDRAGSVSSVSSPIAIPLTTARWSHDTLSKTFRKDVGIVGRPREGGEFAALEARERERLGFEWEGDGFRLEGFEEEEEEGGEEVRLDKPSSLDSGAARGGRGSARSCQFIVGSEGERDEDGLLTRAACGSNRAVGTAVSLSLTEEGEVSSRVGLKVDSPAKHNFTGWCVDVDVDGEDGGPPINADELDIPDLRLDEPSSHTVTNVEASSSPTPSNAVNEPYAKMEVSTVTYSAGADVEVDELVWVEAIDEALAFFKSVADGE